MSYTEVAIVRRPRRRTHLAEPFTTGERVSTWCGLSVPAADASGVLLPMNGGATTRLVADLKRELDGTTCLRCTRLAMIIVVCHATRDTGRFTL